MNVKIVKITSLAFLIALSINFSTYSHWFYIVNNTSADIDVYAEHFIPATPHMEKGAAGVSHSYPKNFIDYDAGSFCLWKVVATGRDGRIKEKTYYPPGPSLIAGCSDMIIYIKEQEDEFVIGHHYPKMSKADLINSANWDNILREGLPPDTTNYTATCRNCSCDGPDLRCECLDRKHDWKESFLEKGCDFGDRVQNVDGVLTAV